MKMEPHATNFGFNDVKGDNSFIFSLNWNAKTVSRNPPCYRMECFVKLTLQMYLQYGNASSQARSAPIQMTNLTATKIIYEQRR